MDVITTSLEALIQRAINPENQKSDTAAIEAFCVMVNKEVEGVQIATKLLASWIQSTVEWQALQALTLLDTCMKRCGPLFNSEVGKFRFLNEMIKLVSPKYLGNTTPISIREKVLSLLETWTVDYPREIKIKEAYEMLRKQGVVKNSYSYINNSLENMSQPLKNKNPIFDDEERSKLLQKLLQSKNPDDLHAANRLIKTMVKEDEKRVQQNSRRLMELESVHNNVKLLSDMLDSYDPTQTNAEDVELMKELYEACERLQPTIERLAQETQDKEDMLVEVVAASDDLEKVRNKYARILLLHQPSISSTLNTGVRQTLLDLPNSNEPVSSNFNSSSSEMDVNLMTNLQSDMELLGDVFGSLNNTVESIFLPDQPPILSNDSIMQPTHVTNTNMKDSREKALDDLNELGEFLLKSNLTDPKIKVHFGKTSNDTSKVSLNSLIKQSEIQTFQKINFSTNYKSDEIKQLPANANTKDINGDDALISINAISTSKDSDVDFVNKRDIKRDDLQLMNIDNGFEIKSLTDINISLETITPGAVSPVTVINEKNGLSVILNFAKGGPRPDVSVIVVTTMSKNHKPLKDYLFQAVVPEKCKCRLQPPSETKLPAHNPFLPPSAITQIMLIANPYKEVISLKFMLSYTIDGETVTEMGEVDQLPIT